MRAGCLAAGVLIVLILAPLGDAEAPSTPGSVKVTLLGTGSPTLSADRMGPCTLVEAGSERLLFDAGRGLRHPTGPGSYRVA